uniref:Uncharacterized protein n=1 Tax=Oryza barthii TaxID=65489 RepID=A0A0D3H0C3_9ORYZ
MPSSPGFSFGQKWRGGRRVVERRSPGPALRGGGSMKSPDEGASVRCGGCCVLPFVCVGVLSWWTAICSQGWAMAASLDVVTTVVASFSESLLCGVAVGLAAFGHV